MAQIFLLTILLSLFFAGVSASEGQGGCDTNDLGVDIEADAALSLMQRRAHVTSSQHTKTAAAPGKDDKSTVKAPVQASKPWKVGALTDAVGPVPLGLSMLQFQSDIHTVDKSKITPEMRFVLLIVVPIAAVGLMCILYVLMTNQKNVDDPRSSETTRSGQQTPLKTGSTAGTGPLTQSSLASSAGSLTRLTPTPMAFSPIQSTLSLPAQQMPRAPSCLLFPTMAADVRRRGRSFDVYWGTTQAPWFRLDVKPGAAGHDRMELLEVHDDCNKLCAGIELGKATVEDGQHFRVTNDYLKANTRGLAYRNSKDESKVRNAVASWGTTVPGQETHDGWLQVGDWYLPMKVNGYPTIVPAGISDGRSGGGSGSAGGGGGLKITGPDGLPFATFKLTAGAQWTVVRHGGGQPMYNISIGTNNFLLEARLPSGKRMAAVKREQVKLDNGEMMLELCVEPASDPVLMLLGSIAVLRQLPAHQE